MFKRMSVLVRRPSDDVASFSRKWQAHAAPVSCLPRLRGYIQNHVLEAFSPRSGSPIKADGFVELLWDRAEDMTAAFASPAARPMIDDEPGFLGHGSGYALARATPLREATGSKLIVPVTMDADRWSLGAVERRLQGLEGLELLVRDDVAGLIAKPGMAPPQAVDAFFHLYFRETEQARRAGEALTLSGLAGDLSVGAFRVRTLRFV